MKFFLYGHDKNYFSRFSKVYSIQWKTTISNYKNYVKIINCKETKIAFG